jgi:hypothetical protein
MAELITVILGRLEDRYGIAAFERTVPERVKLLRQRVIARLENSGRRGDPQRRQQQQDLDDLFFVMQLYSYPVDYLTEQPTLERLAETFDKLEEDVLGVRTARRRGLRRAIVSFGEPVLAEPEQRPKTNAADLTWQLQTRVQSLLDELNDSDLAEQVEAPRRPAVSAPAGRGALHVSGSAA